MVRERRNTFIKPSSIHGLGLFASRDIAKDEEIIQGEADFNGDYRDEWIKYIKLEIKSYSYDHGLCMVNHSSKPNTHRDSEFNIIASDNIKTGDEITEDYNKLKDDDNPFKRVDIVKTLYEMM